MKKLLTLFLVVFIGSNLTYSQSTFFEDDFESYVTGTLPTENWVTRFSGQSAQISEAVSNNGAKSFELVSSPSWVRVEAHELSSFPDDFNYEVYVYVNQGDKGARIGLGKTLSGSSYGTYNKVSFTDDGNVYFTGADSSYLLQTWAEKTWYKVKVNCDFINLIGKAWVDDVLMAENVTLTPRSEFVDFCLMGLNWTGSGTSTAYFDDIKLVEGKPTVISMKNLKIISNFSLNQNYPNPFNPSTTIKYKLNRTSTIVLRIYSVLGQHVKTLVDELQSAGVHAYVWDSKDSHGSTLSSGFYIYELSVNGVLKHKKMLLIR